MRKGQNRKVKFARSGPALAGRAGCLGLLALGLALVNPVGMSASAFAEGEDGVADDVAPLADTPSTVGISFSPAKYYAELAPTDGAGQSARIDLQTTIYVYNSGGYSVYLKSDNPNLVGEKNDSNFIPGATTAKTYANMDVNTWGYAWTTDAAAVANDATYKAVTASGNGDKLAENTDGDIEVDTKTIALSFATKINDEMPADTYSNTMILSVVSSPREVVTWSEITTMQEMTSKVCSNADIGATKQLKDVRDGKFYWVTKLADGKCWMTQNLDLDLTKDVKLTADTSDVPAGGYTPSYTTATVASSGTVNSGSQIETRSWSLGDYYIAYPNDTTSCGTKIGDTGTTLSACKADNITGTPNMFAALSTPTSANGDLNAHYLLGNYYQWNAATAGTGGSITSGTATNSICPKGWRLPTSNIDGEFQVLMNIYGVTSGTATTGDTAKLVGAPLYFVRSGHVSQDISVLFAGAGVNGYYWSFTPNSNGSGAYYLAFRGSTSVAPSDAGSRYFGFSIRCVAR